MASVCAFLFDLKTHRLFQMNEFMSPQTYPIAFETYSFISSKSLHRNITMNVTMVFITPTQAYLMNWSIAMLFFSFMIVFFSFVAQLWQSPVKFEGANSKPDYYNGAGYLLCHFAAAKYFY